MSGKTSIEWTEQSWNPIVGCSIVSPGCTNCYAMGMAYRFKDSYLGRKWAGKPAEAVAKSVNGKAVWTGQLLLAPDHILLAPLRRKKPTVYFVNSMGDLFHEDTPVEWIDKVFAVMALTPQHTYQVLTKRAERMRDYMSALRRFDAVLTARDNLVAAWDSTISYNWPPQNVWLGVSTERQQEADERIPHLLQTPAAVRFISAEPLLGAIDLTSLSVGDDLKWNALGGPGRTGSLDWVIVGGESGPRARPMHPDWARSLRDQCLAADVHYFFKQWGAWLPGEANRGQFDRTPMNAYRRCDNHSYEWPQNGEVQNFGSHPDRFSGDFHTRKVGKATAGRLLDGIEHNGFPEVRA